MREKLLVLQDVIEATTLSRSVIYDEMSKNNFPKPMNIGARKVVWLESDIDKWLSDKIKAHRAKQQKNNV